MNIRYIALVLGAFGIVATACGTPQPTPSTTSTSSTLHIDDSIIVDDDEEPPIADPPSAGWTVVYGAGTPWGPDGHGAGYWESSLLAGEHGMLVTATGEGEENAVIDLFHSVDGVTWTQHEPVLGSLGIEFFDLAFAGPDGFILGGLTFEEEGDQVGTWLLESADGATWTDADTEDGLRAVMSDFFRSGPDAGVYGTISSLVHFDGGYVAGGNYDQDAVVWVSDDGRSWDRHTVASGFGSWISGLAVANDRIYAVGSAPVMTVWESGDAISWTAVAGPEAFGIEVSSRSGATLPAGAPPTTTPPEEGEDEFGGEIIDGEPFEDAFHSGSFVGLTPYGDGLAALIQVERRRGDAWCYVDPTTCFQGSLEIVASTDGVEWLALPMPDDASLVWDGSLATAGGTLVLAEANDGRLQIWTAEDLGEGIPIEVAETPDLGFEIVRWDATVEQGVTYGYPFWTHCGIDRLGEFNGQTWEIIEDTSHDLPEEEWSKYWDMLYGTMVLVAPDRIEYTLSGVVIATYGPAEEPEESLCA